MTGGKVDRAGVMLPAAGHAIDDSDQEAVPALLPFFVAARHYSYQLLARPSSPARSRPDGEAAASGQGEGPAEQAERPCPAGSRPAR